MKAAWSLASSLAITGSRSKRILAILVCFVGSTSNSFGQAVPDPSTALTPQLVLQTGHTETVASVAFSPQGRWIASASADSTIRIWEVATGREVWSIAADRVWVGAVAFSPDGRKLASAGFEGTIRIWEVETGKLLRSFEGNELAIRSVAFSPDGQWILFANKNHAVVFDVNTSQLKAAFLHKALVHSAAFSPDGKFVVSGGADRTIKVWDVKTEKEWQSFPEQESEINVVAFTPSGHEVVSGSEAGKIKIWDVTSAAEIKAFANGGGPVRTLIVGADGRWLAAGGNDKSIPVWDVATGKRVRMLSGHTDSVDSLALSPDGRWLASGSKDHSIKIWDAHSGSEQKTLSGHSERVASAVMSSDGRWLAVAGWDKKIRLWETATGRVAQQLEGHTDTVTTISFSPNTRWLASSSWDKSVRLWDIASGRQVRLFANHTSNVNGVAFSPDSRLVASGGEDGIRIWEAVSGKELLSFGATAEVSEPSRGSITVLSGILSVAFSPDGKRLVSGSRDKLVTTWDVATGKELSISSGHSSFVQAVQFSPDGSLIASSAMTAPTGDPHWSSGVRLWSAVNGRPIRVFGAGIAISLAFSPNGKQLVTGHWAHGIGLFDVETGKLLRTIDGHSSKVHSVAYSPDGRWIISGSEDGSTRIWDPKTGNLQAILLGLKDGKDWLVVTPDGLFDGSDVGTQSLVAWRIGKRVYPPDRFFADFYTPGLLARILAGDNPKPDIDLASLKLPPDVRIVSPLSGTRKQERIFLDVVTEDLGGGVGEVRLFQNGKLVNSKPGNAESKNGKYGFEVTLVPGENILKATAFSAEHVESNDDAVRIVFDAPKISPPTLHLLVVGINKYEDSSFDLKLARPDGEAIAALFQLKGPKLFQRVNAITLFDEQATKANIRKALETVVAEAKPEDVVILYLAGHGVGLQQQFYFLPHEMKNEGNDEDSIRRYGIPATLLGDSLKRIRALKQMLVIDACQSAAALPILAKVVTLRGLGSDDRKATQMLARSNGVYLIAASTKQQSAAEVQELGHGVLTYAFLNALGESGEPRAAVTSEGAVTVLSLLQYINEQVPELTERYYNLKQYPVSFSTGMDFPLSIK